MAKHKRKQKVKKPTVWTEFWDMHSGGRAKEKPYEHIYIQAPKEEAKIIFYNRFHHRPDRVTCTCCGEDYSIDEAKTLEEATAFQRNCKWSDKVKSYVEEQETRYDYNRDYITIEEYVKYTNVLIITKDKISESERKGEVPEEGYV